MDDTLIAVIASQPQGGWYVGDFSDEPLEIQTYTSPRLRLPLHAYTTAWVQWGSSTDNTRAWRVWQYGFDEAA